MTYYGMGFSSLRPEDLLSSDWFLFGIVFLITYAMTYFSLSKIFYTETKRRDASASDQFWGRDKVKNTTIANVISVCISLLVTAAFTRMNYLTSYFGDQIAWVVLLFALIVFFLMTIPFYRALVFNLGPVLASCLFVLSFWLVIKFALPVTDIGYMLSVGAEEFLQNLSGVGSLVIAEIAAIVLSLIFKRSITKSTLNAYKRSRRKKRNKEQ